MNQITMAPAEPISTTQRQPSKSERRDGHQQECEERHDRHGEELEELVVGEGAAAMRPRHQFGNVGVDRHQLDADADAGDEAPEIDARSPRSGTP